MQDDRKVATDVDETEAELYFLVARFLSGGPCLRSFQALVDELEEHSLLPKRIDWLGNEHKRTYDDLFRSHPHISSKHLLQACQRFGPVLDKEVQPCVPGTRSLLGAGRQSILRKIVDLQRIAFPSSALAVRLHTAPLLHPVNLQKQPNTTQLLFTRELSGAQSPQHQIPTLLYRSMQLHCRRLGHLSSVYCLLFDRTGRYIFTGADDLLVKIWSACDGRLLLTLRGHSAEITDMAINYENTLLAAGSCDKIIRVWCLRTTTPVAVLAGHTGMITSLKFCPCPKGQDRYLVSTGNDGCVFFWQWNVVTSKFNTQPRKFTERNRPGAQMQCSSFSPGGNFLATGSTDHHVRVYNVYGQNGPERLLEVEAHSDRVDSIQFCNHSERFVSGSKDGTANVWRFERQKWRKIPLRMQTRLHGDVLSDSDDGKVARFKVTMVGWDVDDRYVLTAVNDHSLKVWNSHNGNLVYILEGHDDDVFVLEAHPTDPRMFLSAGHDGRIILWDLSNGSMVKNYFNLIDGQGHGAVFDCKFSPDGRMFASTDSHGHLSIFGFGNSDKYKKIPGELFFHTDYRPLIRDANHHVLDEQTQQAPHLMPPPFLVNIDGDPYPPEMQRLVPGRESCNDASLVPHVIHTGPGEIALLEPIVPIVPAPIQEPRASSIDVMIERLQRQRDGDSPRGRSQPSSSRSSGDRGSQAGPPLPRSSGRHPSQGHSPSSSHGRLGSIRRSGDVEGVRQSHGNWQTPMVTTQGELLPWSRRVAVVTLDPAVLRFQENRRRALSEAEISHYRCEKRRRPETVATVVRDDDRDDNDRSGKKELKHGYRTRASGSQRREPNVDTDYENSDQSSTSSTESDTEKGWQSNGGSDSDSESSEYSDWTQDANVNLQPPKRGLAKSARIRNMDVVRDDDEDEDDDHDAAAPVAAPTRKSARSKRRRNRGKRPPDPDQEPQECTPEFRPSEWLAETRPRKTPYYPQMGDEVIYFRQGHKCYIEAVQRSKVYKINERSQPWQKLNLRDQELVKVVGIKYEIRPPRLCCLKLAMIDPESGRMTDQSFTIKYHDMPDVIDFLVLRQTYDVSMRRQWKAGDKFRSLIDDKWWVGTIMSQEPFEEDYPDSMFQCFNVHWDSKDREKMSPWDFEPLDEARMPEEHGGGVSVLPGEQVALHYRPRDGEWPPHGAEQECRRILNSLIQITELSVAEPFNAPVDINAYPTYARVVEYPVDLSLIRARLESGFYRRITSVQFDVRFIEHDAKQFNKLGSSIVKKARIVTDLCLKLIEDPSCTDIRPLYQSMNYETGLHSDTSNDTSGFDSQNNSDVEYVMNNKKKKRRKKVYNSNSWKMQCKKFLDKVIVSADAMPFQAPVDPLEYPDYRDIIDTPMDLGTVKEQLLGENYETPVEFCKDMRLIFQNSRNYNVNKRSKIYSMTIRLSALFEDQIRRIISDWKSAIQYEEKLKNNCFVSKRRRPISQADSNVAPSASRRGVNRPSPDSSHSNSRDGAGPSSSSRSRASGASRLRKPASSEDEDDNAQSSEDNKENRVQNGRPGRSCSRSKSKPKRTSVCRAKNGHFKRRVKAKLKKGRTKRAVDSEDDVEVNVEDDDDDGEGEEEDEEASENLSEDENDNAGRRRNKRPTRGSSRVMKLTSTAADKLPQRPIRSCQRNGKRAPPHNEDSDSSDSMPTLKANPVAVAATTAAASSASSASSSSTSRSAASTPDVSTVVAAAGSKKLTVKSPKGNSKSGAGSSSAASSSSSASDNSKSGSSDSSSSDSDVGAKKSRSTGISFEVITVERASDSNSESSDQSVSGSGSESGSDRSSGDSSRKKASNKKRQNDSRLDVASSSHSENSSASDAEEGAVRRSRRTSTRNSTKATRNAISSKQHSNNHKNNNDDDEEEDEDDVQTTTVAPNSRKRRLSGEGDSKEEDNASEENQNEDDEEQDEEQDDVSDDASAVNQRTRECFRSSKRIATRNLGRRTVRYRESDFKYSDLSDLYSDSGNSNGAPPRRKKRRKKPTKVTATAAKKRSSSSVGGGRKRVQKRPTRSAVRSFIRS